ncbi:hypothetical protein H5410_030407 [Solanum commersonii]|uniref:Uncharacterized protein n=1 Tax=Solanum commersonii TaxID=4109 RepID=A0A9J5YG33_SOLCO|nr:hypothetical protein H5410_030407 [Solanum commersonii]
MRLGNFKLLGSLRSVIDGVKGRFYGTLSRFGLVAVLRGEVCARFREAFGRFSFNLWVSLLMHMWNLMVLSLHNQKKPDLSEIVENDGIAGVQQETDDVYSSIDWIDTEEEKDIDNDSIYSDQSIDYRSDVHEELRIVKEDVRKFRESRRRKNNFQSDEEQPISDDELEGGSLRGEKEE